jgi:hypothetical protein
MFISFPDRGSFARDDLVDELLRRDAGGSALSWIFWPCSSVPVRNSTS